MNVDEFFDRLVVQAVGGDAAAFEQLLVHCHDQLLIEIRRGIPLDYDRHFDAHDILQETFRAAFEALPSLRAQTRAEFAAWITTIARHQLDNARHRVRAKKRGGGRAGIALPVNDSNSTAAQLLEYLARSTRSAGSVAGNREYMELMHHALGQLGTIEQDVLRRRFVEQERHAEIGAALGRTEDAVKMICFRALRRLRAILPRSSSFSVSPDSIRTEQ